MHDHWGNSVYWEARRSMRFSKALVKIANAFRSAKLNSTDEYDHVHQPDDWRHEHVISIIKYSRPAIISFPFIELFTHSIPMRLTSFRLYCLFRWIGTSHSNRWKICMCPFTACRFFARSWVNYTIASGCRHPNKDNMYGAQLTNGVHIERLHRPRVSRSEIEFVPTAFSEIQTVQRMAANPYKTGRHRHHWSNHLLARTVRWSIHIFSESLWNHLMRFLRNRFFIGTYESTFTYRIYEEREIMGFPIALTFNTFCKTHWENSKCQKNPVWQIAY